MPALLVVAPGLAWLAGRDGRHRLVLGLVGILVPIATFVAITIMGSWFPGRSLMTAAPLLVAPMVLALERTGTVLSIGQAAPGVYGVVVTGGLAEAAQSGEVTIIVVPSHLAFQAVALLLPQYTSGTLEA